MLAVLLLSLCSYSYCNEVKLTSPNQTTVSDDHYAEVPLQFVFPFYGEEFETSYMFTNGVVGFRNPEDSQVESHWCCDGLDLVKMSEDGTDISRYGYAIAPLWTDLIDLEQGNSGLFTEGDTSQQTYRWKNLAEFYDATRLNTFELQIKKDGTYIVDYTAVNIQDHTISTGEAGNLAKGVSEGVQEAYYPNGYEGVPSTFGNLNLAFCDSNALYDPSCPNYAEAYAEFLYTEACNADATYDPECTGYAKAYLEQQCMYNPQYDKTCAGYVDREERKVTEEKPEPIRIEGENPISEVLEQPDLITDFAGTTGYQIEGMPSASAPVVEPRREEVVNNVEPRELEQREMEEPSMGEESFSEIVQREREPENREEQKEEREEPKEELKIVEEREKPVDEQNDRKQEQPIEKTVANEQAPKKAEKKQVLTKNDKLKALVSKRAVALSKKVEGAVTLEQQIVVQQQLMSLISFVPDFNYAEQEMKDLASFYPSKDNVDNAFARWFVNDKNFIRLEDLQYPQRNTQWQR